MNELELKLRVRAMTKSWVNDFMSANSIPASIMTDALTAVLSELKDDVMREFIESISVPQSIPAQETDEREE